MSWISVKERLPENDDEVLCYYTMDGITVGFYSKEEFSSFIEKDFSVCITCDGWNDNFSWARTGECTHWMTLPEPPKD